MAQTTTTTTNKGTVIQQLQLHQNDTGSPAVQIGLLTQRINGLSDHFKAHKHDVHSRHGLLKMVTHRRRLLEYLKRDDEARYRKVLEALDLRK